MPPERTIANANTAKRDVIMTTANGVAGGSATYTNAVTVFDLETVAGTAAVENFELTVGTFSMRNKWAVNSIQVSYTIPESARRE